VALHAGDRAEATRWFERAHRVAPDDPSALFLLISALVDHAPERALRLLDDLIDKLHLHRDARVSRSALLYRLGRPAAAAVELDALLCNFAAPRDPGFRDLADKVCAASGHAGWVGVRGDGVIIFHGDGLRLQLGRRRLPSPPCGSEFTELPKDWRGAGTLITRSACGTILGAHVDLASVGRIEGVVSISPERVLSGWAVAVADPDTLPVIEVFSGESDEPLASAIAEDERVVLEAGDGATRVRGFCIPLAAVGPDTVLHVHGQDGRPLMGSPIRFAEEARACRVALSAATDIWRPLPASLATLLPAPLRVVPARREIDVIIPLYRGSVAFASCLASLASNALPGLRIVAIDDGIAEPDLRQAAEAQAANGLIILLHHRVNRGFPAAVNTGLRHAAGRDVLLLNSDTLLPPGALGRLAEAAYSDAHYGTATPLTTDGTLTTCRCPSEAEPMPEAEALAVTDEASRKANATLRVQIPTCVGFCVLIRHDCLAETGLFREDAFAQGYGEETDFSLRAAHFGWRHVVACDVVVAHAGGTSFGAAGAALRSRNLDIVERLHPGYGAVLSAWIAADPLKLARFALEAKLWEGGKRERAVVLVTHNSGGGVERCVAARAAALRQEGTRPIVIRPGAGFQLSDGIGPTHPNLRFSTVETLATFLRDDNPISIELHHVAAHDPAITRLSGLLRIPFDIFLHDFAAICPRVTLCGGGGRYCGEPVDWRECEDCIADHGARIPFDHTVASHRANQAMLLRAARRVVAPSRDAAERLARFVSRLNPVVTPWEDDRQLSRAVELPSRRPPGRLQVGVVGGIGEDKGFDVLLGCARDAERRNLPLQFIVVGHTSDDNRLMGTNRVFISGRFTEGDGPRLLREFAPHFGFIPSVWPETWCFALSTLWQAGLHVVAFDLGAQAERIRSTGAGTLLPLGVPARRINDGFLSLALSCDVAARPGMHLADGVAHSNV